MYNSQLNVTQWTSAPLQITLAATIETEPSVLFQAFSNPETMCQIFTWMDRVTIAPPTTDQAQGVGAIRTCYLGNGLILEEEIVNWQPPYGYVFRGAEATHPFGMRGHVGVLSFNRQERGCHFLWLQYFEHNNVPAMREQLEQSMKAALNTLIHRFGGQLLTQEKQLF